MRGRSDKPVDVPKSVLSVIDEMAGYRGIPTKRLVAELLWDAVRREVGCGDMPAHVVERARHLPRPYHPVTSDVRLHARRGSNKA